MFLKVYLYSVFVVCFALFLSASSTFTQNTSQLDTLQLVILVHRHGFRSPLNFMSLDPYSDPIYWPEGISRLLPEGKRQMYQLGVDFRSYYSKFLTESPVEVQARSSDADRCLQSILLLLYGLYKAQDEWSFDERIDYQPIPVHSIPGNIDEMLNESVDCPAIDNEIMTILASPEAHKFMHKHKSTIELLKKMYHRSDLNLAQLQGILDEYSAELMQNYSLPNWISKQVINDLQTLTNYYAYLQNSSPLLLRLRTSAFFNDIKNKISSKILNNENRTKLLIYSTHDTYVGAFMQALQIFNNLRVPNGATLVMELHQIKPDDNRIKIFYKNQSDSQVRHVMKLPFCDHPDLCSVAEFFTHINQFITSSWSIECNQRIPNNAKNWSTFSLPFVNLNLSSDQRQTFYIITAFSAFALLLIVFLISLMIFNRVYCRKDRRSKLDYEKII